MTNDDDLTPMKLRRITIHISMWEDAESFDWDQRDVADIVLRVFPGAQVGLKDDVTHTYGVAR